MRSSSGQIVRLKEMDRRQLKFRLDGRDVVGLEGDTLLTAILTNGHRLRMSEFGDGPRAGFCMMAACQDCWVEAEDGQRLRACTTMLVEGLSIRTRREE